MRIALIALVVSLTGCATPAIEDDPLRIAHSNSIPCGPNNCGKTVVWETR